MYLHYIGNDGQFDYPFGLVVDKYNQLVVCDAKNGSLQFFTLTGKFLSKLWDECFNEKNPYHVAINNNDSNLLLADLGYVHIFH